jgi:hypothetical protein
LTQALCLAVSPAAGFAAAAGAAGAAAGFAAGAAAGFLSWARTAPDALQARSAASITRGKQACFMKS